MNKIDQEKKIVGLMIELYCKKRHKVKLCEECASIKEYAFKRLDLCPFGENKKFCSSCKIHCYEETRREKMKEIMRFAGPRMIFYHPIVAFRHLFAKKNKD